MNPEEAARPSRQTLGEAMLPAHALQFHSKSSINIPINPLAITF
jgi:hypothetical protein